MARNPKDVIVSFYYHHKLIKLHNYTKDFDTFADYFLKDESANLPCSSFIREIIIC